MTPRLSYRTASAAGLAILALTGCTAGAAVPAGPTPPQPASSLSPAAKTPAKASTKPSAAKPSATTSATPTTPAAPPAPPPASRPPITGADPVTMAFAGDVHFEKDKLRAVAADPNGLSSLKPYLSRADITVVNLETAVTTRGTPIAGKQFTFRAPESALTTLANAGVDVAGMANNHGADFGPVGLVDTMKALPGAPLKVIGIGQNLDQALSPATFTVDGVSIAVFNARALKEETTNLFTAAATKPGVTALVKPYKSTSAKRFLAAVKDASARYDVVVAFLHYGEEGQTCPTPKQVEVVNLLADAGADAVIGGHSHRVQAGGWTKDTYVNYGLGSFTWWLVPSQPATGVLTISIDKQRVAAKRAAGAAASASVITKEDWQPMLIGASGLPSVPDAAGVARLNAARQGLLGCSKLSPTP